MLYCINSDGGNACRKSCPTLPLQVSFPMSCEAAELSSTDPSAEPTDSPPARSGGFAAIADRFGATASFLCAIHCALLPFVIAVLPALGLAFLADHRFERGFIAFASVLALT